MPCRSRIEAIGMAKQLNSAPSTKYFRIQLNAIKFRVSSVLLDLLKVKRFVKVNKSEVSASIRLTFASAFTLRIIFLGSSGKNEINYF